MGIFTRKSKLDDADNAPAIEVPDSIEQLNEQATSQTPDPETVRPAKETGNISKLKKKLLEYQEQVSNGTDPQEAAGGPESEDREPFVDVEPEQVTVKPQPKRATKKRGDSKKSVNVKIDASMLIAVASAFLAGVFSWALDLPREELELTDTEMEMLEPMTEAVISENMQKMTPTELLIITASVIYGGKVLIALRLKKLKKAEKR